VRCSKIRSATAFALSLGTKEETIALRRTAITAVQVKVDGTVVGNATYGISRPDVCNIWPGRPGCPNMGYTYQLNTGLLGAGSHTITVTAADSDGIPDLGSPA